MTTIHSLGFPRIGIHRENKWAVEKYWRNELTEEELEQQGSAIRRANWQLQMDAGLNMLPVGDFSWYDHILDMSVLLGVVPQRFGSIDKEVRLTTYFHMARGKTNTKEDVPACDMTKWFNTNYHYIVPEFSSDQKFQISCNKLFKEIKEAQALTADIKPVIIGPLTYLWLGKAHGDFDKLKLLPDLIMAYQQILREIQSLGVKWVQIDEPILVLDLPEAWQQCFSSTYQQLKTFDLNILLATYFGALEENYKIIPTLAIHGLHIDAISAPEQIQQAIDCLKPDQILSLGIIDGRNIWRADLTKVLEILNPIKQQLGLERLWLAPSCSLLHCPIDLENETLLDAELKSWLAFSKQKLEELKILAGALNHGAQKVMTELSASHAAHQARLQSSRCCNPKVVEKIKNISTSMIQRSNSYDKRKALQQDHLQLPLYPTTTIGSFPQTKEVRALRQQLKKEKINQTQYDLEISKLVENSIQKQLEWGLDVLVHGEFERNDMVEYFGELLSGFAFTENGWIQSYGSRCVKPPIIYGDVSRQDAMTVKWSTYAQSLTTKPVKGMLTGPVTIVCWSFVRDDIPRLTTAKQIALALRDEVLELEQAGIKVIQIDEPAFREGLPLRKRFWDDYLSNAINCFHLAANGVQDITQIHTHMCYSEFNDIIASIAQLDADVITIETSRSNMELLKAFEHFKYPNDIGPGVFDIHSPRIPTTNEMLALLKKATQFIPGNRLWINPDCGLKTRAWSEVAAALKNMVTVAQLLREETHGNCKK
jgi:5-methyltetrahydropteroyltriglutamate--homocysteine methyltransferase